MDPMTMMAVGAGMGAGKAALFDAPKERKQRELASQTALYSPWTGLNPMSALPERTDYFGSAMQGGMAGGMMGQGMERNKQQQAFLDMEKEKMAQGSAQMSAGKPALQSPSFVNPGAQGFGNGYFDQPNPYGSSWQMMR